LTLAFGTLATFSFYQWTLSCTSGAVYFLSAFVLVAVLATLAVVSLFILRLSIKGDGSLKLYMKEHGYIDRWGSMYDTYKDGPMYFVVALVLVVFVRSLIIGFGQNNGFAQVIALIILEGLVLLGEHYLLTLRYES
jgi:Transient receptor potential (TRP) ion channel